MTQSEFDAIRTFASQHRQLLALSARAGCFHCCTTFAPKDITVWIAAPLSATGPGPEQATALCPHCGIDAVLPSVSYYPLTDDLLAAMHHYGCERLASADGAACDDEGLPS